MLLTCPLAKSGSLPSSKEREEMLFKWANLGPFLFIFVLISLQFQYNLKKAQLVCLGFKPRAAGWQVKMKPWSYGGHPKEETFYTLTSIRKILELRSPHLSSVVLILLTFQVVPILENDSHSYYFICYTLSRLQQSKV